MFEKKGNTIITYKEAITDKGAMVMVIEREETLDNLQQQLNGMIKLRDEKQIELDDVNSVIKIITNKMEVK